MGSRELGCYGTGTLGGSTLTSPHVGGAGSFAKTRHNTIADT